MNTPPPTPENNTVLQKINSAKAQVTYANFCRGTLTPEEVILDLLGFNTNAFGVKVLDEDLDITNRVIMSPSTAKRLLLLLNDIVRRHEANSARWKSISAACSRTSRRPPRPSGRTPAAAQSLNARTATSAVRDMSASVCAVEMNPASNCDGAK